MKKKLTVHMAFVYLYIVAAVLTLVPVMAVSKPCRLGYKALCSFTPISTVILLALCACMYSCRRKLPPKRSRPLDWKENVWKFFRRNRDD